MTPVQTSDDFVFADTQGASALRKRLRLLMAEHLPAGWLGPFTKDPKDLEISNRFCQALAREQMLVPDWPSRFGGSDLDLPSSVVIREEMWANFEPRGGQYYGPNWVGPSIFQYGTEDQQRLHLPLIAAGQAIWCQGFSEPDAGSDLASLRTRAVRDGDGFRISGQKTWTSWARWADWCYLLARVEGTGAVGRHQGITVFLIPMSRAGITVRGLDGIPGPHHLNEVFLDDVWAHSSEVLGEVGNGWTVIRDALSNERVGIARYARGDRLMADVLRTVPFGTLMPANRWVQARVRNRMARLMCRRALWFQKDGGSHDFIVSAARIITTRADLTVADLLSEAVGDAFFEDRDTPGAPFDGVIDFYWRYMQAGTIASGTTEMLQRQLAKAIFRGDRIRITPAAEEFRASADRLFADRGGVAMMRAAISDPASRLVLLPVIDSLTESLDPRDGHLQGTAAAELCRAAGRVVLPAPIEAMLLRRPTGRPLGLLSPSGRLEHSDLFAEWDLGTGGGAAVRSAGGTRLLGSKVGPFVNAEPLERSVPADPLTITETALLDVLKAWFVLGALEQSLELASHYALQRTAFGATISSYQGVSFPLADASAELQGLYEMGLHALWSAYESPATAAVDALALRWSSIDIARRTLRTCHQVLGAIGLCDEHDMAIISLSLQARLRLPTDLEATAAELADAMALDGFDSIHTPVTD